MTSPSTANTTGTGLERLMRFARNLGAQPHAVDAADHDRLLADISHLPHVLANALVTQAAGSINTEDGSIAVVGPSFRDATRVAGANSSIRSAKPSRPASPPSPPPSFMAPCASLSSSSFPPATVCVPNA